MVNEVVLIDNLGRDPEGCCRRELLLHLLRQLDLGGARGMKEHPEIFGITKLPATAPRAIPLWLLRSCSNDPAAVFDESLRIVEVLSIGHSLITYRRTALGAAIII
jgi:hypothetical protein